MLMKYIKENKLAVGATVAVAIALVLVLALVMSGGADGTVSDNAKLDQSKKVETTTAVSTDNVSGGATKLGNIGSVAGSLNIGSGNDSSKRETNTKEEVTEGND